MIQTEYPFTLPKGFVDQDGNIHKEGTMRLATAADEILPLKDPRVMKNQAYLIMILLSRVLTRLGDITQINPGIVEKLFVEDLKFLENMYNEINGYQQMMVVSCPDCKSQFEVVDQYSGE